MQIRLTGQSGAAEGFTLLEVIAALTIGLIMIAVLFVGIQQGNFILTNTRDDLRATQILLQKAEAIRLLTWPQLTNCPTTFQTLFYPGGGSTNQGITYYGTLSAIGTATNIPNTVSYQPTVHMITISITWTNFISNRLISHSRSLQTLSAVSGMQNYLYGVVGP
jgi:prepilin-type N-terminal cleavage/methylation domain-containing protein